MTGSVSWSHGPGDSRGIRLLLYVAVGVPLGLAALLLVLFGQVVLVGVRSGNLDVLGGGLALVVLGGLAVRRFVWVADDDTDEDPVVEDDVEDVRTLRTDLLGEDGLLAALQPRGVALAAVAGAAALVLAASVGTPWLFAALVVGLVLPTVAVGLLTTEGELDVDDRRLRYGDAEIPLTALAAVHRLRLGSYAFCWCRFVAGSGRTPQLVVLPAAVDRSHADAFEAGVVSDHPLGQPTDDSIRLVAYMFGGLMASLGALSFALLAASGTSVLLAGYVGGALGLLGAFFAVVGRYEA
jgi:hypothetical protein